MNSTYYVYCGFAIEPGCVIGVAGRSKFFFTNKKIPHNTLPKEGCEGYGISWKFCGKLHSGSSLIYDIHEPIFRSCCRGYSRYKDFKFLPNEEANALYQENINVYSSVRFTVNDERVIPSIITHEEASEKIVGLEDLKVFDFSYIDAYWY